MRVKDRRIDRLGRWYAMLDYGRPVDATTVAVNHCHTKYSQLGVDIEIGHVRIMGARRTGAYRCQRAQTKTMGCTTSAFVTFSVLALAPAASMASTAPNAMNLDITTPPK